MALLVFITTWILFLFLRPLSKQKTIVSQQRNGSDRHELRGNPELDANHFDYNKVPAIPNFFTLAEPSLSQNSWLVILVLSSRKNLERRSTIRQTWGKNHTLYFAVGGSSNASTSSKDAFHGRLLEEQRTNQDLIDTVHPESYRGLPHKLKFAIRWIVRKNDNVKWIFKVDDDVYLHLEMFHQVLLSPNASSSVSNLAALMKNPTTQPIVIGRIMQNMPIERVGTWAEHNYADHTIYPPWPQGSCGYVVSRAVGNYIANQYDRDEMAAISLPSGNPRTPTLTVYQGEDTSLGIWMKESGLNVTWVDSSLFVNHGDCMISTKVSTTQWSSSDGRVAWSIGHHISPQQTLRCYTAATAEIEPLSSTTAAERIALERLFFNVSRIESNEDESSLSTNASVEWFDNHAGDSKGEAYWSAMALQKSNLEAKQRLERVKQRKQERARIRQHLD